MRTEDVKVITNIWVCTDCLMARESDMDDDCTPDREPWGEIPTADVALSDTCGDMGACDECREYECTDGACECGRIAFAWNMPCDGCGSRLGGTRHRYAVFAWER